MKLKTGSKCVFTAMLAMCALAGAQTPTPATPETQAAAPTTEAKIDPKAKAVLDRYIQVTGGKAAYEKVKTREIKATIEFVGQGISGTVITRQATPDKLYMVMDLAGIGQIESGFDGTVGWNKSAIMGTRILEGKELEQLKSQATSDLSALTPEKFFTSITHAGEEVVNGKPADKVELDGPPGKISQLYDKESGLLVQMTMTSITPQGEIPVVTTIEDYREVGGMKISYRSISNVGAVQVKTVMNDIKINPELPADTFKLPADIKKMVDDAK